MHITLEFINSNKSQFYRLAYTSTLIILEELIKRQYLIEMPYWPVRTIRFSAPDGRTRTINGVINQNTPQMAVFMSENKFVSYGLASELGLYVPDTEIYESPKKAEIFWRKHRGACIIKPVKGRGGQGVYTVFNSEEEFITKAAESAARSAQLLQEKSLAVVDLRLLFVGGSMVAATARRPFYIIGDGSSTIAELLESENTSRKLRNARHHVAMALKLFDLEEVKNKVRVDQGYVLADRERLQISLANISDGGVAEDVTERLHKDFITAASRMDKALKCPVLAVDFLCDDPAISFDKHRNKPVFLETNTRPGIDLHDYPHLGPGRNVASQFIDYVLAHCDM